MEVVINKGRYIEITPSRLVTDSLRGSIKSDEKKIDEIIKADVWEFQ